MIMVHIYLAAILAKTIWVKISTSNDTNLESVLFGSKRVQMLILFLLTHWKRLCYTKWNFTLTGFINWTCIDRKFLVNLVKRFNIMPEWPESY